MSKHEKGDKNDGESLLGWRDRCGNRIRANSVVGTRQYMAPEVLRGASYDGRCDWWSIGIILFECLYGHTPFYSEEGREKTKHNILVSFPRKTPIYIMACHPSRRLERTNKCRTTRVLLAFQCGQQ